jgi:hypothetical protein
MSEQAIVGEMKGFTSGILYTVISCKKYALKL